MYDVPRSKQFDDIYFSKENGLEESRFVFLRGNNLEDRLKEKETFTVAETGFGTGLNFLALLDLIEKTNPNVSLRYISYEQYPLDKPTIREALSPWKDIFGSKIEEYLNVYPMQVEGFHTEYITPKVKLTLAFGDINEMLPRTQNMSIDAWFLDGFTPSKNPEMWTDVVFENMARLSSGQASFATFTSAGFVKRGLQAAGFIVEKTEGFSRKRERLVGAWEGEGIQVNPLPKSVAVIGGGLAGCAAGYWLSKEGIDVTLFEKDGVLASGASGNPIGMVNPRFYKIPSAQGHFYMSGYADAVATYKNLSDRHDIGFVSCGALHLCTTDEKNERFSGLVDNWKLPESVTKFVGKKEASKLAGIKLEHSALYLEQSCMVNPAKLCRAMCDDVDVRLNATTQAIEKTDKGWSVDGEVFEAVILAYGAGFKNFNTLDKEQLQTVRGQLSFAKSNDLTQNIKASIHYGGYISPQTDGVHAIGATFQPWLDNEEAMDEDDLYNLEKLEDAVPSLKNKIEIFDARASLRVASKHRFPVFGEMQEGLYYSLAHGSHGLSTVLKTAKLLINPLEKTGLEE